MCVKQKKINVAGIVWLALFQGFHCKNREMALKKLHRLSHF